MPVINKKGLSTEGDWSFVDASTHSMVDAVAVDCPNTHVPPGVLDALHRIKIIRIAFPNSADGRGFSIAQSLRARGYRGQLRAAGDLISDQFHFAIECGFDDVQISDAMFRRQPLPHWQYSKPDGYRQRLAALV